MKTCLAVALFFLLALTGTFAAPPLPAGTYSGFEMGPFGRGLRDGHGISIIVTEDRKVQFVYPTTDPLSGAPIQRAVNGRFIGTGIIRGYKDIATFRAVRQGNENSFRGFRRTGSAKFYFYAHYDHANTPE